MDKRFSTTQYFWYGFRSYFYGYGYFALKKYRRLPANGLL